MDYTTLTWVNTGGVIILAILRIVEFVIKRLKHSDCSVDFAGESPQVTHAKT